MDSLMDGLSTGVDTSEGMYAVIDLLEQRNKELQAIKAERDAKKAKRKRKKDAVESCESEVKKPVTANPYIDTDANYMALAVAILAPDVVEKDKDGNPIMEEVKDANGNPVLEEVKDENGNPVTEIEKDEKGNIVYTFDCGNMVPKKRVKKQVKTRIKTRDISVDDALHMMGLDRKNNINKNKNTDEVE